MIQTAPLRGLTVVDCSTGFAGTRTTGLLADYGADVTWVEPPGGAPFRQLEPAAASVFNRGKRSVVVDLEASAQEIPDEGARETLNALLAAADILVVDLDIRTVGNLGLMYDALHAQFPALIWCSISGFGPGEEHRHLPAREALVHAVVGSHAMQAGHREGPIYQGLPFAGTGAAYLAAIGILGALYRRYDDGIGRRVETSLFDGALAYHGLFWGETEQTLAAGIPALGFRRPFMAGVRAITRSYVCSDGEYLGIHTGATGAFDRLMMALGLDDRVPPDPDSQTGMGLGVVLTEEQKTIVAEEIPGIFASRPRNHWIDLLMEADVCAVEHLQPTSVFETRQARHNQMVAGVEDPVLGYVEQVAPSIRFNDVAPSPPAPAPTPGQHQTGRRPLLPAPAVGIPNQPDARPLLDGVKILDFSAFYAGPYSSRLLADFGADVIKIEPIEGDPLRPAERLFSSAQAGKRNVAANLKEPDLGPLVDQLVRWADIIHHNLRPGAAERLGLGRDSVQALNPGALYVYASGWGSTGPFARRQSFAPMISGYVGVTFEVAGRYNEPLPPAGGEDPGAGLLGAVAMLMALVQRRRTNAGAYVEIPQLNATLAHMAHVVRAGDGRVIGAGRLDTLQYGFNALDRLYQTADGWVCIVASGDEEVAALAKVAGISAPTDNDEALAYLLTDAFAGRRTAELLADLHSAGVPAAEPAGEDANHLIMNDPEHRRAGRVAEVRHPTKGLVRENAVLVRVSDAAVVPHRLAAELGRDTLDVLAWAGYDEAAIAALQQRDAVRGPERGGPP